MTNKYSIYVNQIGYKCNSKKRAFISRELITTDSFNIYDSNDKVCFTSKINLSKAKKDRLNSEYICTLNFDELTSCGTYYIKCGEEKSFSFEIGNSIYTDVVNSTLRYFYLSRCGQKIQDKDFGHEACHTTISDIYGSKEKKLVLGGWHDAGDYGRYVVAGVKAVMDLLLAYESSPYKDSLNILEEVKFELDWLMQLQREDGAVYHKISCYHFCSFIMPQEEKETLVLAPISTAATADFAGCLLFASNFYKDENPEYSQKLIKKAELAIKFIESNEIQYYSNPKEITTGSYGDKFIEDELYFAYCAMFSITQKREYLDKALSLRKKIKHLENFFWGNVSGYGTEILLKNKSLIQDKKIIKYLEKSIINQADKILKIIANASFSTSLDKVHWGSNGQVCDDAHLLLIAYELTDKKEYYDAAMFQVNYVFGCNPLNICYITGFGSNPVCNPHHRPSGALKKTMPGMLAGGPCEGLVDAIAKQLLSKKSPLNCYIDHIESYSTNEVAIYWNSALVCALAKLGL